MSATAAAAEQPGAGSRFWHRVTQGTKKVALTTKRAAVTTARTTGRYAVTVARKIRRGSVRAARATGRGARRSVGYVGGAITWLLWAALAVIVLAVTFVLGAVFGLLGLAVTAVLVTVGSLVNGFRVWVYGFFAWLSSPIKLTYGEMRTILRLDREEKLDIRKDRFDRVAEAFLDAFPDKEEPVYHEPFEPGDTDLDDEGFIGRTSEWVNDLDPIVVPAPEVHIPLSDDDRKTIAALHDKERLRVQADLDDSDEAFPGAIAEQAPVSDPYSAPGTEYTIQNPILETMNRWLDKNPEKTPVDFRFEGEWPYQDQLAAIEVLLGSSTTTREASFWLGRQEALTRYHADDRVLDESGKAWALVWTHYKGNREVALKSMRVGFMDMVQDLKIQRDKADRRERAARRASA